jgi:hypothetical protein
MPAPIATGNRFKTILRNLNLNAAQASAMIIPTMNSMAVIFTSTSYMITSHCLFASTGRHPHGRGSGVHGFAVCGVIGKEARIGHAAFERNLGAFER